MRSRLESNTSVGHVQEVFFHGTGYGAEAPLFDYIDLLIQDAVVTSLVTQINADRDLMF